MGAVDDLSGGLLEAVLKADERFTLKTRDLQILPRRIAAINEVYGTLREYYRDECGGLKGLLQDRFAVAGAAPRGDLLWYIPASAGRWLLAACRRAASRVPPLGGTGSVCPARRSGWPGRRRVRRARSAEADVPIRATRMFDVMIEGLADQIVIGLAAMGRLGEVRLVERGQRTELSEFVGGRLGDSVAERIEKHKGWGRWRAIGGDEETEQTDVREYDLSGVLGCGADEDAILLTVSVKDAGDDAPLLGRKTYLPVESLPSWLRCGAEPAELRQEAVGAAVMSEGLDREAAERAARNLARARVIAKGLKLPLPDVEVVSDEREAFELVARYLGRGLPFDERELLATSADGTNDEDRAVVRLSARVVAVGTAGEVELILNERVFEVDEPMRIQIETERAVHLGVFAWRGDETVIRLYPGDREGLKLEAGGGLVLPRSGDPEITPGRLAAGSGTRRFGAIVVVAAPVAVNYSLVAPLLVDSPPSPAGEFLEALNGFSLGNMTVSMMPYEVVVSDQDGRPETTPNETDSERLRRQQYLFGMERANQAEDYDKVLEYGEKLAEVGGELPVEARYYQGIAYMELGRNREAYAVLILYGTHLQRNEDTAQRLDEVFDRLLELESRLEADDEAYERAKAADTSEEYADYLRQYPKGRYVEEARQRQADAKDDEAYDRAQQAGTAAWYEQYLREYPNGRHAEEARRRHTEAKDDEAYRRARSAGTSAAYGVYLREHPDGRYAGEARRLQTAIREDDAAFERAKDSGAAESFEDYLREYRDGRHAEEARQRQAAIREDDAAFERAKDSGTAESYGDYLGEYPSGRHAEEARQRQVEAKDDEAYGRADRTGAAASYEEYLRQYPKGRHAEQASRRHAEAKDDEAYGRAKSADTAALYDAYLRAYPSGRHAEEARQLLAEAQARDDEAYAKAKATGTWAAYDEYLREYPNGRHVEEAERLQSDTGGQVVRVGDIAHHLLGITWAGSGLVAVGFDGTIVQSPDGKVWTAAASDISATLTGVAWTGRRVVAVGADGTIVHSPDGKVWTAAASDISATLTGVAWTGRRVVAVGEDGAIVHSPDGQTWTAADSGTSATLRDVAWTGTRVVAVGDHGVIVHSRDGQEWTRADAGTRDWLFGVAGTRTRFVAVGLSGEAVYSRDGQVWTQADSGTRDWLHGVVRGGTRFVAVGNGGAIVYSLDGQTWTAADSDTLERLNGVAWTGTRFVAVGQGGAIVHSPNGKVWTAATTPAHVLYGVAWTGSRFVAVGEYGAIVHSPDGHVWTAADSDIWPALVGVTWNGTRVVAVGASGVIVHSPNGQVWTAADSGTLATLLGVAWTGTRFVAVGEDGAIVHSPNGKVWTAADSDTSARLWAAAWNGTRFVAVGDGGAIVHSPDGQVWTAADSGTLAMLLGVAWNGTRFVAVGEDGAIVHSPNGKVWTAADSGTLATLLGVAWTGTRFVAVGDGGAIVRSPDGQVWTAADSDTSERLWAVAWNGRRFVAVGDRGTIIAGPENVPTSMTRVVEAREGERAELLAPGERFRDCETCPELVVVRAGSYMMGSPASEEGRTVVEGPQHQVAIAGPLAVGAYEVTREQFGSFATATGYIAGDSCRVGVGDERKERVGAGWRDPGYEQTDEHPVVCVSWEDAQAYVKWLSRETAQEYRLLSESEWEYVARGGTNTARYWGETEEGQCTHANGADLRTGVGWAVSCDDRQRNTAPVGSYTANGYGLYDVIGNVWEWTQDCWNERYAGAPTDGRAWVNGECGVRVLRGGSWGNISGYLRSAIRIESATGYRSDLLGFRVSRTL